MRHHLGGEEVHVPPRQIVRKDAELEECHQDAEARPLTHSLDACQHRLRAADQRGAALDQTFGGGLAAAAGLIESGTALIGSPRTVLAGIERMRERTGFGILVALLQFGIVSDELTWRNMDLFAAEVMPHLRAGSCV